MSGQENCDNIVALVKLILNVSLRKRVQQHTFIRKTTPRATRKKKHTDFVCYTWSFFLKLFTSCFQLSFNQLEALILGYQLENVAAVSQVMF